MSKEIKTRIMHKHDTEDNWKKAVNFIPNGGELIIYDIDDGYPFPRTKIGNGILTVNELPFSSFSIENYRKSIESTSSISISDVSPDVHKIPVKVSSKNLIPFPYPDPGDVETVTNNGITYTINSDGTIVANGTAAAQSRLVIGWRTVMTGMRLAKGEAYTFSGCPNGGSTSTYFIQAQKYRASTDSDIYLTETGSGNSFVAESEDIGMYIIIASGVTANNLVFKPQVELGSTATEYTPYVPDGTEVTVRSCGKNLIHTNSLTVPYTDVTTLFEGKITGKFAFSFDDNLTGVDKPQAALFQFIIDGNSQYVTSYDWSQSTDKVFTFSGTLTKVYVHTWNRATGGSLDNIRLEVESHKTNFEPYKEGETIVAKVGEEVELTSISPNMTIFTDSASAVIKATYNSLQFDETWNGLINSAIDSISNSDIDNLFNTEEVL